MRITQRLVYRWEAVRLDPTRWKWTLLGQDTNGTDYSMGRGHSWTRLGCWLAARRRKRRLLRQRTPPKRAGGWLL